MYAALHGQSANAENTLGPAQTTAAGGFQAFLFGFVHGLGGHMELDVLRGHGATFLFIFVSKR